MLTEEKAKLLDRFMWHGRHWPQELLNPELYPNDQVVRLRELLRDCTDEGLLLHDPLHGYLATVRGRDAWQASLKVLVPDWDKPLPVKQP